MAYVDLATQSAGQTASAAGWANVVKANFAAMGPHLIVRKPSDESVSSSATAQDDDHLVLPVLASEVWQFVFGLRYSGPAAADMVIRFTFPAGGEISASAVGLHTDGISVVLGRWTGTTTPTSTQAFGAESGLKNYLSIEGTFVTAGTGGNVVLQWAQNSLNASPTVVHAHSTLWGVKLV